ncbi:MAG: glutamate acetyltransferase [Calothrix sp. C42_A2020_038]|nr:glutamate acetyltransferase [Calothrix sp. C42_A2020_038]
MHKMLLVSKYTAIRQLVSSHLLRVLSIYASEKKISKVPESGIALYKSREICKVLYISGVAPSLAKVYQISASAIANQVVSHFCDFGESFRVKVVPPAWIHIEVVDCVIADWLESLVSETNPFFQASTNPYSFTPALSYLFPIQYAYARCCSLLRLAKHEGITLFDEVRQIPWLDSQAKLCLNDAASQSLIAKLIAVVDDLVCVNIASASHWHSKARSLSQAFERFWSHNCIWGEVKVFPELAHARFGLILATQKILRFLLEDKLGIIALSEL